jgi:hypothetical protein
LVLHTFHIFHTCLILFFIHVCISNNDNKHTLCRNINLSNVSNIIIIKNYFAFNQKLLLMSSSRPVITARSRLITRRCQFMMRGGHMSWAESNAYSS